MPAAPAHPGRGLIILLAGLVAVVLLIGGIGAVAVGAGWFDRAASPEEVVADYYDAAREGDCDRVVGLLRREPIGLPVPEAVAECERDLAALGGRLPVTVGPTRPVSEQELAGEVFAAVAVTLTFPPYDRPDEPVTRDLELTLKQVGEDWLLPFTMVRPATEVPDLLPPTFDGPLPLWHRSADRPVAAVWSALADEFAADRADELTVEVTAHPFGDYHDRLAATAAAGQLPALFETGGGRQLRGMVEAGLVQDLTDVLSDVIGTLSRASVAPYTLDGRVYGIPYHAGGYGFWFNRALFAQAGLDPDTPPRTWGDFLAAVERLAAEGITPVAFAGAEPWRAGWWFSCLSLRLAGPRGIGLAWQEQQFDQPWFEDAAGLLADLAAADPFQDDFERYQWAPPDGTAGLVGSGEAAMELGAEWAVSGYQLPGADAIGDDLDWFPFPLVEGYPGQPDQLIGNTGGFAVAADAPEPALDFLRFLHDDPGHVARLQEEDPYLLPVRDGIGPGVPELAPVQAALERATTLVLPLDEQLPPAVAAELANVLTELVGGRLSPQEAMARVDARYRQESD